MQGRIEKLCESLSQDEAVLITSYPNIFYYSSFTSEDAYLFISKNRRYIITDSRYTLQAHKQAKGFDVLDIESGLEKVFENVSETHIGFEEMNLPVARFEKIQKSLKFGQKLVPMQNRINKPRERKDEIELTKIADAEKIGDMAFEYILKKIKSGVTEREIAFDLEMFMRKQGATALSFETIVASGKRSAMPHGTATDKVVEKGDFVTLDFGCVFGGYCSDMTRTVIVGKASDRQREIYNIVLKSQLAAIDAVREGIACSDVDKVSRDMITDAGYGKNFGHSLGHSVGIEIHENPSFSPKSKDFVQVGNVITVEPGIYIDDFGGVRIEDVVAVKSDGVVNLTSSPKELIEI